MVILHDAIKTIQNGILCFFKEQKPASFQKTQNHPDLKKKRENTGGLGFKKKLGFFSNLVIFQSFFCDFPLIARSRTSHITISLIGCAPHT